MKAFSVVFQGVAKCYPTVKSWRTGKEGPAWGEQHYIAEGETPEDVVKDGVAKGYYLDYAPASIKGHELVLRYRVFVGDSGLDGDGRFCYATWEEAEERAAAFRNSPSAKRHFGDKTFEARPHWCYPGHFDPAPLRYGKGN